MEGYQKSNLKGDELIDLHYGVIIKDIAPEFEVVTLQVLDAKNGAPGNRQVRAPHARSRRATRQQSRRF